MKDKLNLRRVAIIATLRCTLNCKLCSNYIPIFNSEKNETHVSINELKSDIDNIFNLIDYTEWLQFVGGEIFMRKDMNKIYRYCLEYSNKFDKLILITNATVLPCKEDIDIFKEYKNNIQIQISDYGKYSYKINELISMLNENNIPYVVKSYHGDIQHYGGWVDNTSFTDRGKSEDELKEQFDNCGQVIMENFHVYRGIMQGCARSLLVNVLGKVEPSKNDFIDLNDKTMSDDEKRYIIRHFNDSPRESCKSCISFGENVQRYHAAEQVDRI